MDKYAVALGKQSIYAPTRVGEFTFLPEYERHTWRGLVASNMEELAEQTNAAMKAVLNFGDPFLTIEIIQVEKGEVIAESSSEPMSMQVRPRKLQVIGQPVAAGVGATHEEVPC